MSKRSIKPIELENIKVLVDLATDPQTTDQLKVRIHQKLSEVKEGDNFFEVMFDEALSLAPCPYCDHMNHWGVPENDLNQLGWVSHLKDPRVKQNTTVKDCKEFAEACKKKKINI